MLFFSITECIRHSIDNGEFGCGIFIDLKRAFDTLNHAILLTNVKHYEIRGAAYNWFKIIFIPKRNICQRKWP